MIQAEKVNVNKINYDEFLEMVKDDVFKVTEVDFSKILNEKKTVEIINKKIHEEANRFNTSQLFSLFTVMIEETGYIDIHTYMAKYVSIVKEKVDEMDNYSEREKGMFLDVNTVRAYYAFTSNIAEIGFELLCRQMFGEQYEVHSSIKLDRILGCDAVILDKNSDSAFYVHITSDTPYAANRLERKGHKEVTVIDDRIENKFGWPNEQRRQYNRNFKNHMTIHYSKRDDSISKVVNGCFIFNEEYVKNKFRENAGLCDRTQFDEMQHLELSKEQIRTDRFGRTITRYDEY